ncbi:MAG: hypothetical protein ACRC0X_04640 [Brevinema sp.]
MKKYIVLLFLLQCSTVSDPTKIWLQTVPGTWKTTSVAEGWFKALNPTVDVPPNTLVEIKNDGSFTIGGIPFQFVQVENTGTLAIYSFVHPIDGPTRYIGLGFNIQNNILFNPTIAGSPDQIQPIPKGSTFLKK